MDHELRITQERLANLLRMMGAETFDDAADALTTQRHRIHDLSNDVYAQRLLLNEVQRQLGCEDYVGILQALARLSAQVDNLEAALERALHGCGTVSNPIPGMVAFRQLEKMAGEKS